MSYNNISCIFYNVLIVREIVYIPGSNVSTLSEKNAKAKLQVRDNKKDDIAVFSSSTCFKKTYYAAKNGVKVLVI